MKFIKNFVELCRDEDGAVAIEYVALAVLFAGIGTVLYDIVKVEVSTKATTIFS